MKIAIYILLVFSILFFGSCEEYFIEKPEVTGLNLDEVFSTGKNAEGAIAEAYSSILSSGLPVMVWNNGEQLIMPYEATEAIMGGEDVCKITWSYMDNMCASGFIPDESNNGAGYTDDYFPFNYAAIRKAWLVYENIDKAVDMTVEQKNTVKGEMQVLVAFRYLEMLKRYGGVPIVEKTLIATDTRIRSTVQEVIDFIVKLCNEASISLNNVNWPVEKLGRINEGVALAVKAEALTYAARPLFNSDSPYLAMTNTADNLLICLGNEDNNRWQLAIDANKQVIEWGNSNGFELIDTDNPLADYGAAVGKPSNIEVLLAYKQQRENDENGIYKNYTIFPTHTLHDLGQYRGTSFEQLIQYRKVDGTDQNWLAPGESALASEYRSKAEELEPRALASLFFYGLNPKNNTGNARYDVNQNWQLEWKGQDGCAKNIKFWFEAGTREWFEFPIYRMAEFYLNIAEAYNELGNSTEALSYLNIIRNRGGIPDETATDKLLLRKSIQREWAVEFYEENQYYPHARHWKLGASMVGGSKHSIEFTKVAGINWNPVRPEEFEDYKLIDAFVAKYAWDDRMYLSPFTLTEVNKGYLVQNPGY